MEELKKIGKNKKVLLAGIGVVLLLIASLLVFMFLNSNPGYEVTTVGGSDGPRVGVIDDDKTDESEAFLDEVFGGLKGRALFRASSVTTLKQALAARNIDIGIIISEGFSESVVGQKQTTITVLYDPTETQSSQVNQAVAQVIQNYSQQHGGVVVVQAVIVTPPPDPGSGGTGGTTGVGGSSSGENPTNKPRRVP